MKYNETIINHLSIDSIYTFNLKRYNTERALANYIIAYEFLNWKNRDLSPLMEKFKDKLNEGFQDDLSSFDMSYFNYKNGYEDNKLSDSTIFDYQDDYEKDLEEKLAKLEESIKIFSKEFQRIL